MPATAHWLDAEHTIIHQKLTDPLQVSEIIALAEETYAMIEAVPHEVTLIFDVSQTGNPTFQVLSVAKKISKLVHPRQKRVIGVTKSVFLETLAGLISRVAPNSARNMVLVKTLDEALERARTPTPSS